MVERLTRVNNILDLFLTNNPTLVSKITTLPGLSDHDAVYGEVNIKPQVTKSKPHKIPLYKKADLDKFRTDMRN